MTNELAEGSDADSTHPRDDILVSRRWVLWGPILTGLAVAAIGAGTSIGMNVQTIQGQIDAENLASAREAYQTFLEKISSFIFSFRYNSLAATTPIAKMDEIELASSKVAIYGSPEAYDASQNVVDELGKVFKVRDEPVVDWQPVDDAVHEYQRAVRRALKIVS